MCVSDWNRILAATTRTLARAVEHGQRIESGNSRFEKIHRGHPESASPAKTIPTQKVRFGPWPQMCLLR